MISDDVFPAISGHSPPIHSVEGLLGAVAGVTGLEAGLAEAWGPFVDELQGWLRIEHRDGIASAETSFLQTLDGQVDPAVGLVLSV